MRIISCLSVMNFVEKKFFLSTYSLKHKNVQHYNFSFAWKIENFDQVTKTKMNKFVKKTFNFISL